MKEVVVSKGSSKMDKKESKDSKKDKKKKIEESESESDSSSEDSASESEQSVDASSDEESVSENESASASESEGSSSSEEESDAESASDGESASEKESASDSSDSSDSSASESEEEAPAAKNLKKVSKTKTVKEQDSSDESDSEVDSDASEEESDKSASSEEDSEEEDSEEEGSEEEEDVEMEPIKTSEVEKSSKRKATETVDAKKIKTENSNVSRTIFVGNLSWNVDKDWLYEEFKQFGEIKDARVVTDRNTGKSKGVGYVEFSTEEEATAVMNCGGKEVDGRQVKLDYAKNKEDVAFKSKSEEPSSPVSDTLFIGNLSFNTVEDTLYSAFEKYGTIVSVRIPTDKETGQSKGFGYVQYEDPQCAQKAIEMNGADVDGRKLRLDFSTGKPKNEFGASGGSGFRGGRGGFRGGDRGGRGRGGGDRGGRGGFRGGRDAGPMRRAPQGAQQFSGKKIIFDE